MKRFIDWLKPDSQQQSAANRAEQASVSVRVRSKEESEGKHNDDSSFNWLWIDQADSSIFDTGILVTEESEDENAGSHRTLDLEGNSLGSAKEDIGVDPYNTGSFDTEKK